MSPLQRRSMLQKSKDSNPSLRIFQILNKTEIEYDISFIPKEDLDEDIYANEFQKGSESDNSKASEFSFLKSEGEINPI